MKKNSSTSQWHKCRTAKVISKDNAILLDIINADKYKVESDWIFIKDCYGTTHHYPVKTVKKLETKE